MADISKINVVQDYNVKDSTARTNMIDKNTGVAQTCLSEITFTNGIKIGGSQVYQNGTTNIVEAKNNKWDFKDGLASNGKNVLTTADLDVSTVPGKKSGNGEIFIDYTNNTATGQKAFVAGENVNGGYANQTIFGKYNDNKSTDALEVGWGSSSTRKNIMELTTSGDLKVNNVITSSINLNNLGNSIIWHEYTNNSAISTTTTSTSLLTVSGGGQVGLVTIPVTLSADGEVQVDVVTNLGTKTYKKYCQKGSDIINFSIKFGSTVNSIELKIKTSSVSSDLRILQAKINTIDNYLKYLTYTEQAVDTTAPTVTIGQNAVSLLIQ